MYFVDVLSKKSQAELNQDGDADKYFEILQAACESKNARLMEIALDATHYLIGEFNVFIVLRSLR
jgi:hypothetical protein